jgi:chromosome segregation ATPase
VDNHRSPDEVYYGNDFEIAGRVSQTLAARTLAEAEAIEKAIKERLAAAIARVEARQGELDKEEARLANEEVRLQQRDAEYVKKNELLKNAEVKQREGEADARNANERLTANEAEQKQRQRALDANDGALATLASDRMKQKDAEIERLEAALGDANALLDSNGAAALVEQCKLEVRATKCEMLELEKEKDLKYQSLVFKHSQELAAKDAILAQKETLLEREQCERLRLREDYTHIKGLLTAERAALAAFRAAEQENLSRMVEDRLRELGGNQKQLQSTVAALQKAAMGTKISIEVMQKKIGTLNYETKEFQSDRVKNTAVATKAEKTIGDLQYELGVFKRSNMQLEAKNTELTAAVANKNLPTNDAYALYLRSENVRLEAVNAGVKELCQAKGATQGEIDEAVSLLGSFGVMLS